MTDKAWNFVHDLASEATWTPGLREIFEYRDLGIKGGTAEPVDGKSCPES